MLIKTKISIGDIVLLFGDPKWRTVCTAITVRASGQIEYLLEWTSDGELKDVLVYVLAKNDGIDSALHRIYRLMAADKRAVPFVMPYRSLTDNSIMPSDDLRRLARWCNRAWIRKSCRFEDYR